MGRWVFMALNDSDFKEIKTSAHTGEFGSQSVQFGKTILPQQQIFLYSPAQWEAFIEEWAQSKKDEYVRFDRFGGSGDMGIDIAGMTSEAGLQGIWDNYQCKHYPSALTPTLAWPELAKVLWYSFKREYTAPRKYYFVAPKECGAKLKKLLLDPKKLKEELISNWDKNCSKNITVKETISLQGAFRNYVDSFDFSIFTYKNVLTIIEEHRQTPYFSLRFGGGLNTRPNVPPPPKDISEAESRYIQQLFEAYSEHKNQTISNTLELQAWDDLIQHFHHQRECFYHAETLRNFARDNVPPGTFEALQTEVHAGVFEVEASIHLNAYARMTEVLKTANSLNLTANALISVIKIQDRKGICHQLANENRLKWRKND